MHLNHAHAGNLPVQLHAPSPFYFLLCLSSRATLFSLQSSFSWAQDKQTFSKLILKGNYQVEVLWEAIKGF